jgi:hypothetical protein
MNPGGTAWIPRPFARPADPPAVVAGATTTQAIVVPAFAIGVFGIGLRVLFGPQLDGIDDAGYLDAARRVSEGRPLNDLFALFQTRVGMAYPLGWLLHAGWLEAHQFWVLTLFADGITLVSLLATGWLLTGTAAAGLAATGLYAIYPLAVQQSAMYQPTSFQVAAIAAAIALIALAERREGRRRLLLAFAAGVALGIGYLFKEDVAVVVAAIALATLVARFPRVTTTLAMATGAAVIFGAECVAYWRVTGEPLYRLTSTSGLGYAAVGSVQMADIWRWDAFLRSLWLMPAQVGLIWWLAIPALLIAWRARRTTPAVAFVATVFVILMLYLQFGSGSLSSYSPLPKTPRYTALATAPLMLVVGAWIAQLIGTPRRLVVIVIALAGVAAPCILYLHVSSSERTRNTLAVLPLMEQDPPARLYADYYTARLLGLLLPDRDVRVWYHANFKTKEITLQATPGGDSGAYVLLDRQAAKIYTSSYELALPPEITAPPSDWQPVWTNRAYADGSLSRSALDALRHAAAWLPAGNPLTNRVNRSIADIIDGDLATLYRVP